MSDGLGIRRSSTETLQSLKQPLLPKEADRAANDGGALRSVQSPPLQRPGSLFDGRAVAMRQPTLSEQVQDLQADSRARLGQPRGLGSKVANCVGTILTTLVAAPLKLAATAVATVGGLVLGGIVKAFEAMVGVRGAVRDYQAAVREELGVPLDDSILNRNIQTGAGQKLLMDAMEEYRDSLGGDKRLSSQDMLHYVAMGERIVRALQGAPGNQPLSKIDVRVGDERYSVEPNLETTRAISWYLQAKALVDNSGDRPAAFLKEGAMVAKDPGNRLYNFLSSSDNAYGRVSTHMQERSDSGPVNSLVGLWKGGIFAAMAQIWAGQPLQYGIEDFDSRMPSKGGCLLFDKLKSSTAGGEPEIFLKWEAHGTPNSFALGLYSTHADHSLGDKLLNRGLAAFRSVGHGKSTAANADPAGYRGEKMDKGEARVVLDDFTEAVKGLKRVDSGTKEKLINHVKTYGAAEMVKTLNVMIAANEVTRSEKQILREVLERLERWIDATPDLGIARKGNELHVRLT